MKLKRSGEGCVLTHREDMGYCAQIRTSFVATVGRPGKTGMYNVILLIVLLLELRDLDPVRAEHFTEELAGMAALRKN
ncbi:MAG: hypothetical protein ACLUOI_11710 [Eisenbergiella sp.]